MVFNPSPKGPTGQRPEQVSEIKEVVEKLKAITHAEVGPKLDAKSEADPSAGIVIAPLPEFGSVLAPDGQEYKFYAARVYPNGFKGSKGHVNPHFHTKGDEPYQILTGTGVMHIGRVNEKIVTWTSPTAKKPGDTIIVKAGEVHSFENMSDVASDFTFSCPDGHLSDTDRFFTMDKNEYKNGFPEYKKSS